MALYSTRGARGMGLQTRYHQVKKEISIKLDNFYLINDKKEIG